MPELSTIHIEEIGTITLTPSSRAKRLSIRIAPGKGVRVTIPRSYNTSDAISFVKSKKKWIVDNVAKVKSIENKKSVYTQSQENITKDHSLILRTAHTKSIRVTIGNKKIHVTYPQEITAEHPRVQEAINNSIIEALRIEAKKYLPARITDLALKHNLRFNKLTLRNPKTRWGSCSGNNNISLSIQLMKLPEHLCDYVILHELAHTIHKNHGPQFWKSLDTLCNGNAIKLRKELRYYSLY